VFTVDLDRVGEVTVDEIARCQADPASIPGSIRRSSQPKPIIRVAVLPAGIALVVRFARSPGLPPPKVRQTANAFSPTVESITRTSNLMGVTVGAFGSLLTTIGTRGMARTVSRRRLPSAVVLAGTAPMVADR